MEFSETTDFNIIVWWYIKSFCKHCQIFYYFILPNIKITYQEVAFLIKWKQISDIIYKSILLVKFCNAEDKPQLLIDQYFPNA